MRTKLVKSREGLFSKLKNKIFTSKTIDEALFEELEEILIQSDMGTRMTMEIIDELEKNASTQKITESSRVYELLQNILIEKIMSSKLDYSLKLKEKKLNVILIVGVNGVGKTTTIGKLAMQYKEEGYKVVIGAADTFRAAAVEQLKIWADRAGVTMIKKEDGADPGAVVFESIQNAKAINADILIIDTAGRLQNKSHLMDELGKLNKIIVRETGSEEYERILVLDSTTGQNAISQAEHFNEAVKLTGVILTKLDGTAKGGVVFNIINQYNLPIKYIGVGESIDDLMVFSPSEFVEAIFN
ncbi:MAG: signal recognition particle-docking protein FtsY [Fusobacteria bacterium]|nr:signal recognition particle-docking protein FtsY [Fusobacteriota bacterium]